MGCGDIDFIAKKERAMIKKSCIQLYNSYIKSLSNIRKQLKLNKMKVNNAERLVKYIEQQLKNNRICNCLIDSKVKKLKDEIKKTKVEIKNQRRKRKVV